MQKNWLIFTDLDGTLLDSETYSFNAALPALNALKALQVPIILNSSKTISELADISAQLDVNTPIIAENGSIIFDPQTQTSTNLGVDYAEICQFLDDLRTTEGFTFAGFHDWDIPTLQEFTGLDAESAKRAKQRQATEPLIWSDDQTHEASRLPAFKTLLSAQGLKLIRGGRFWHVMGNTDKVVAMQAVQRTYEQQGRRLTTIALGDSPNDNDMLCAADIGILVKNPHSDGFFPHSKHPQHNPTIITTAEVGPAGWNQAMINLIHNTSNGE